MNQPLHALATRPTEIDLANVQWTRVTGGPEFDYPIDYSYCVSGQDKATNTVLPQGCAGGVQAMKKGDKQIFTLSQGQVLNLESAASGTDCTGPNQGKTLCYR